MTKSLNVKKRRAQRGRPRLEDIEREPNGRGQRGRNPRKHEDPRKVVLDARQRIFGLSPEDAATDLAGSALGRLRLAGQISEAMLEAGKKYRILWTEAMRALTGPEGLEVGGSPGVGGDIISDDWVSWATRATANYRVAASALGDINAFNTVEYVVVIDEDPVPAMMPALTEGLLILALKFGMCREPA
jgi:hypothetical protein